MPKLRDDNIDSRLRARRRGGPTRYYADFRDYRDVGGKIEKLCPPGGRCGTTSETEAKALAEARLDQLKERRATRPTGDPAKRTFGMFAAHHLEQKVLNGVADEQWLAAAQRHLEEARAYFGEARDVADIQVSDVSSYMKSLNAMSNGRGGTLSAGTVVQYLNSLSSVYRRAISEGLVAMGSSRSPRSAGRRRRGSRSPRWRTSSSSPTATCRAATISRSLTSSRSSPPRP